MHSKKIRIWAAEGFAYAKFLISKHFSDVLVLMYLLYMVYRVVHCKKMSKITINQLKWVFNLCWTAVKQLDDEKLFNSDFWEVFNLINTS